VAYIPCTNLEVNPLLKASGCASLVSVKKCPLLPCWTSWRKKLAQNCVRSALLSRDLIKAFDVIISKTWGEENPRFHRHKNMTPHSESDEQKKLGNGWLTSLCREKQFCPSAIHNKKSHARSSSPTEILRNHPRPRDAPRPQRSMQNRSTPLHSSRASGHGV
jgi:hypothetical protein